MSSSADLSPASIPARASRVLRRIRGSVAVGVCGPRAATGLIAAICLAALPLSAQDLPRVTPEDYGRWENLGPALLSPRGDWIAYEVTASTRARSCGSGA